MSSENKGSERRKYPRALGSFVVSYRILEGNQLSDLTQTKNLSQGGFLITTNRKFDTDTALSVFIRLPFSSEKIHLTGRVVDSREVVRNLIYETRLSFVEVDDSKKQIIDATVNEFLKKDHKKK